MKRRIIAIDGRRCTGCGLCMLDCPAGSLEVTDGRSHLVDDRCCDGGGACVAACPREAISVMEREVRPFDGERLMERVASRGEGAVRVYLERLRACGIAAPADREDGERGPVTAQSRYRSWDTAQR